MSKSYFILIIFIWFFGIRSVASAQPRYGILGMDVCWRTAAGVDSSLTGYYLIASQGAKQFIFYTDAYGAVINYDTTGTLRFCHCADANTLACFYAAQGGYAYVQDITLSDGTQLSAQSGFNFPYAAVSDLAQLQTDLSNWLFAHDPCNTYVVTVQLDVSDQVQIMIDQTCIRFANVTFSNSSSGGGVTVPFSENCSQVSAPHIIDANGCSQITCNPFRPPPVGPSVTVPFYAYISGTDLANATITLTFNGDPADFTFDPVTGYVSGTSPYQVTNSCFGRNPVFNYTWVFTVTTDYGTDTYTCSGTT